MRLTYLIIIIMLANNKTVASEYIYSSVFYNETIVYSKGNRQITFVGEKESFDVEECSTIKFECFKTFGITFSVTKNGLKQGNKWSHNGYVYAVNNFIPKQKSAFGVSYFVIHSVDVQNQPIGLFMYSEKEGLIGMRLLKGPHQGDVWIKISKKGFPM